MIRDKKDTRTARPRIMVRERPRSAGPARRGSSRKLIFGAENAPASGFGGRGEKKAGARRGKVRLHKRAERPASAGRVRNKSTRLRRNQSHSKSLHLQYIYHAEESLTGHAKTSLVQRRLQQLEKGWDSRFAQSKSANALILASKQEIQEFRRRDWMNNHASDFSALNKLRKSFHGKKHIGNTSPGKRQSRVQAALGKNRTEKFKQVSTSKRRRPRSAMVSKRRSNPLKKEAVETMKTRMRSRRVLSLNSSSQKFKNKEHSNEALDEAQILGGKLAFVKRCKDVRHLFEELHIPTRDRKFFIKTFMAKYDAKSAVFVEEQLALLKIHREETLRVLSCIRRRENAIKHVISITKACASSLYVEQDGEGKEVDFKGKGERNFARNAMDEQLPKYAAILADSLRRAQLASCEVVEAILAWRKHLWRPQPFKWKGNNYMLRMGGFVGLQVSRYLPKFRRIYF